MKRVRPALASARVVLFPTPVQAIASAALLLILAALAVRLLEFFVLDAAWNGGPEQCRAASGACWPFVAERLGAMVFGFVPHPLRWAVSAGVAFVALLLLATREAPSSRRGTLALLVVVLCTGSLIAGGALTVTAAQVGGLLLTVAVAGFAILSGLPLGLGLALMRTSRLPIVRGLATVWIEVWRGLPTVVVLFFAIAVFPLLVPREIDLSKLLRTLLAFTLLTSAQFAEAFRGGLQVVGDGQREAAYSLGLGSWRALRLVILPQALTVALPNIVNICVALIKETTLVLIIGLYDFFGVVQTSVLEPRWAGQSVTATGYAFAAAGYLGVCAGVSHFARRLEAKLSRAGAAQYKL